MLFSLLDPDLIIYEPDIWSSKEQQFWARIEALTLHRRFIRSNNLQIAISNELAAAVYDAFPWSETYRHIDDLRDLRQFVYEDLGRACYLACSEQDESEVEPEGATCHFVKNEATLDNWKSLLARCVEKEVSSESDFHIATIATSNAGPSHSLRVTLRKENGSLSHQFPLISNENHWTDILASVDAWPDLAKCVEQYFLANPGMQRLQGIRNPPDHFACTDSFLRSVNRLCTSTNTRQALIKAIAKRVYGVLDPGLHDEFLTGGGGTRRFRVTEFLRIHYRNVDGIIVLEQFGEHDIGL